MNDLVKCTNLGKSYQHFNLRGINISIPQGYVTGLIGPNGSGKTTLIKLILSLLQADQGQIYYQGQRIASYGGTYLQDIGIIMDEPFLSRDWTANDIDDVMKVGYRNWQSDRFFAYLVQYQIDPSLKVKELSRGMSIKLMLAIALSHQAKTLILDEPTSGLDPIFREELTDVLQDFVQDDRHSVLFSTHITADLEAIADYLIYIQDGNLLFQATKDEFLEKYVLVKGPLEARDQVDPRHLIGAKATEYYIEALMEATDAKDLSNVWAIDPASIDQIMIHLRRRDNQ